MKGGYVNALQQFIDVDNSLAMVSTVNAELLGGTNWKTDTLNSEVEIHSVSPFAFDW